MSYRSINYHALFCALLIRRPFESTLLKIDDLHDKLDFKSSPPRSKNDGEMQMPPPVLMAIRLLRPRQF